MNTEKAIELIGEYQKAVEEGEIWYKNITDFPTVINLLERGEKYEEMWEELEKEIKESDLYYIDITANDEVNKIIAKIKQKYFPIRKGK